MKDHQRQRVDVRCCCWLLLFEEKEADVFIGGDMALMSDGPVRGEVERPT